MAECRQCQIMSDIYSFYFEENIVYLYYIQQKLIILDKREMISLMDRKILKLCLILMISACFSTGTYGAAPDPQILLDKAAYIGYGSCPVITMVDDSLNINPKKRDVVDVNVSSSSDSVGISVTLTETASGSGKFTGKFSVNRIKSDDISKTLLVRNKDTITVSYTKAASSKGNSQTFTRNATWQASTGTVKLLKKSYTGLNTIATVSVSDKDLNLRNAYYDTAKVRIYSDADPKGILLTAYETGPNTSTFEASFRFSTDKSNIGDAIIKVNPTNNIYAEYIDEIDETGAVNVRVISTSTFQFSEAVIKTSAKNDEGEGCLLTITIDDPDENNPNKKDRILAKASSGNGTQEMTIRLDETGKNTGSFKCNLLLNDEMTTAKSLRVKGSDIISIKYADKTVPQGGTAEIVKDVKWTYIGTLLKTDKKEYYGYNSSAKITLTDYRLNTDDEKAEKTFVKVTTSDSRGIKLELKETSSDSGVFTGTLYFGKTSKASKRTLRVVDNETITVTFTNPKNKDDIVVCYAAWSFQDGQLKLDKQQYMGDNVQVKITLNDTDLNENPAVKEGIKVIARLQGGGNEISVVLEEASKNSERFTGTFYINGTGSNKPSLKLNPGDKFEVVYTDEKTKSGRSEDRIQSAVWGGISKAVLTLDKKKYIGFENIMVITLYDTDQSRNSSVKDKVSVQIRTKSGLTDATYTLTETGPGNGEFMLALTLTDKPNTPTTIKVAPNDEITVNFTDKGVSASAIFTKE